MFEHITANPEILSGKPHIRGTRISVAFIMELVASGASGAEIKRAYPYLPQLGIDEALRYATLSLQNEFVISAEIVA